MNRTEAALALFNEGFRCSQAVLEVFAEQFGINIDMARKMSLPLAAGSGNGGECGAVSGAYLVLGLKYGLPHPGDPEGFQQMFAKVAEFSARFKTLHKELDCSRLIGLDLFCEEGRARFVRENIKATHCCSFVADTIGILEEMMVCSD